MQMLRTRFAKDIVAEFLPPRRPSRSVIIVCRGMPSVPATHGILAFLSRQGYWAFQPRYRGSWESGGRFLRRSPHEDILDVISGLPKGFTSAYDGKQYRVKPERVYLIGSSFGGPAVILASRDPRVTKVVAFSPVINWAIMKDRKLHLKYLRAGFGEAYRFSIHDWKKLQSGTFYNPSRHIREIDGRKLFIIHAKDDQSVAWRPVKKFAEITGAELMLLSRGGHLSTRKAMEPRFYKRIKKFFSRP